ncbi:MAG TPA: hypothetical protein VHC70_01200 [Phycisphaerales bacterium]|nr:hypothetical protein [Phycisphaerales bacterium]
MSTGTRGLGLVLVLIVAGAIGLPVLGVILQVGRAHPDTSAEAAATHPLSWGAMITTVEYSVAIGLVATVLGLPAGWALRRRSAVIAALICVPLLMPIYLAYAGWGLLRGPGSWVGDMLGRGPHWLGPAFDHCLAACGLSLWAWPIAALIVGASARRIPSHLLDSLDLEPGGPCKRASVVLRLLAGSIGASVLIIGLVMAGSAIPLQLAQVDTYTVHLCVYLSLTTNTASIWGATLPLLGMALIAGGALAHAAGKERTPIRDEGDTANRRHSRGVLVLAAVVWGLSVPVPMGLFVWHLRWWVSLWNFWKNEYQAVGTSLWVGAAVGIIIAILAMATWALRASVKSSKVARGGLWATLAAGLFPGTLVGSATLAFWNAPFMPRAAGDTLVPVVLAHVARFGFIGVLAGWWMASLETPDERGARLMLAGDGVRAWAALCLRPAAGVVVGIALAGLALSLHEIESTIYVQPPGPSSLAQYILDKLHYNRDEDLCAACVNVLAVGTVLAGGAGWLIGRAGRPRACSEPPDSPVSGMLPE